MLWMDYNFNTPPAYWDGESYAWEATGSGGMYFRLTSGYSAGEGDVVEFDVVGDPDGFYQTMFLNIFNNNSSTLLASVPFDGQSHHVNVTAQPIQMVVSLDEGSTSPLYAYNGLLTITPTLAAVSYNCECDDDYPRITLAEMRKRLMRRLGFAVQANNPPPGMADLLDDFVRNAQEMLFRRYNAFRRERFYTWDMQAGVRFYDLDANADVCTKKLDPHMVSWVGVSDGDDNWIPLVCGIDPTVYTSNISGIPDHYEIRQCIEVWPPPADNAWKLRIKGQFGLMPLEIDSDETTVEPEAIFLLALANAKAHYGQPDAGNYASQLTAYIRDLVRGSHHTARYLPGRNDVRNAVRPVPVGGWPEDP